MSWPASLGVAFLTAVAGMFVGGFIGNLCVGWYRISSFEGGAGYFVISIALLGLVVGGVAGIVAARVVAAWADPGFLKALGAALGTLAVLAAVSAGTARALADVPPTLDGETMLLAVELRWPPGRSPDRADTTEGIVTLGSVNGAHVQRASERGPLWLEDAHEDDGRWVVPGAVRVFTERGTRSLTFSLGEGTTPGFIVPLPRRPGRDQLRWSEWQPHARPGAPPLAPDMFTYRFRVVRTTEPIRRQTVGPFEVQTIARAFYDARSRPGPERLSAVAEFAVRHAGQPVVFEVPDADHGTSTRHDRADGIASLGGSVRALLVHVPSDASDGDCFLLTEYEGRPHAAPLGGCLYPFAAPPLTNDVAEFGRSRDAEPARGRLDRDTFARPGLYLLHDVVLDTRTRALRRFTYPTDPTPMPSVPPLGISPDERSIVHFDFTESDFKGPILIVTDVVADRTYTLPIDAGRMHFQKYEMLDPAWVLHYFAWRRLDGVDRLEERTPVAPLPYRGTLNVAADGNGYYWLEPARPALEEAVVAFLVDEMHGERMPKGEYQLAQPVRVGDATIEVSYGDNPPYVHVSVTHGGGATTVLADFARRFDAALATGRYDALFGR